MNQGDASGRYPQVVIDSSTCGVSMALALDSQDIKFEYEFKHMGSGEAISRLCCKLLRENQMSFADVSSLVVAVGPGSFTGIKVGIAFVSGLLMGRSVPVASLSALRSAACHLHAAGEDFQLLALKQTRTHGFAVLSDEKHQYREVLLDLTDEKQVDEFASFKKISAEDWPLFCERWPDAGSLPIQELSKVAIKGMVAQAANLAESEFVVIPPSPSYMRLSTAEERLKNVQKV